MKMVAFGASVTAQKFAHDTGEVTGYVEVLRRKHMGQLGISGIEQVTYEGNRASDGGLVRVLDLLKSRPQICLFEPNIEDNSRGQKITASQARFLFKTMLDSGALPITVFLPDIFDLDASKLPNYELYKDICREYNIPNFDIDITDIGDLTPHFRNVHTTVTGAPIIAGKINDELRRYDLSDQGRAKLIADIKPIATGTHVQSIPNSCGPLTRHMQIKVHADRPLHLRLVQPQKIGVFSPVLQIHQNGRRKQRLSVWDQYCYFERNSCVTLLNTEVKPGATIDISISNIDPAYAKCNRDGIDWPDHTGRHLKPTGDIFAISSEDVACEILALE